MLRSVSSRAWVGSGDLAVSSGFVVGGTGLSPIVLRAIGPSLTTASGGVGALLDPTLDVFDSSGALIASNDNWRMTGSSDFSKGSRYEALQPTEDRESAIALDLPPGAYTAVVRGLNQTTGTAVAELYEFSDREANLSNASVRGFLQTADDVLVVGLGLQGQRNATLILRALGPSLTEHGIPNALSDPFLDLYDNNGVLLASNNDWQEGPDQLSKAQAKTLGPKSALESAISLERLPPGDYTAVLRGNNSATGVGVLEVYDLR